MLETYYVLYVLRTSTKSFLINERGVILMNKKKSNTTAPKSFLDKLIEQENKIHYANTAKSLHKRDYYTFGEIQDDVYERFDDET